MNLTHFDAKGVPPPWIADLKLEPIYRRTSDVFVRVATDKVPLN